MTDSRPPQTPAEHVLAELNYCEDCEKIKEPDIFCKNCMDFIYAPTWEGECGCCQHPVYEDNCVCEGL